MRPRAEAAAGAALAALACSLLAWAQSNEGAAGAGPAVSLHSPPPLEPPAHRATPAASAAPAPGAAQPADRPVQVHQTTLRARLDPAAHRVHGEGEIRWKNTSIQPQSEVYFHLYLNAFKNSRTAFLRTRLGEGRGEHLPASWGEIVLSRLAVRAGDGAAVDLLPALEKHSPGDPEDQTDLRAALPAPCLPGGELTFEVTFESTLPSIVERTGYQENFHMVAQWFPKLARLREDGSWSHFPFLRLSEFDADFGRYDVTLEAPASYVIGATGERVEEQRTGDQRSARYVQEDVHDFAWTAWDGFREREAQVDGVKLRFLYPEGHEPAVDRELDGMRVALPCMRRRLGDYPYRTLTVVHPPPGADEAGGMEYPSLITTGGPWYGPPWLRSTEAVTIHEFGHQYFYGLLASDEHRSPFLDEGLNTFLEVACLREGYGKGSLLDAPGLQVDIEAGVRWLALPAGHDHAIAHAAADFPTAGHYGRLAYFRTAALLSTLRRSFGEEPFDRAFGGYVRGQRFRHPTPDDLIGAFAAVDPAMGDALAEGLLRRGWIDAAIAGLGSGKVTSDGGLFDGPEGRKTEVATERPGRYFGWVVVARRGTLRVPIDVLLRFADGSERTERWSGQGEWARLDVEGPAELVGAEADPGRKLLLDEDWSNNAQARRPQRMGMGTFERGTFAGSLFGLMVAP